MFLVFFIFAWIFYFVTIICYIIPNDDAVTIVFIVLSFICLISAVLLGLIYLYKENKYDAIAINNSIIAMHSRYHASIEDESASKEKLEPLSEIELLVGKRFSTTNSEFYELLDKLEKENNGK